MYGALLEDLTGRLEEVRQAGTFKTELVMSTPQGAHVDVEGRGELLNLCANNYLGLASHPEIVAAAHEALDPFPRPGNCGLVILGRQVLAHAVERHHQKDGNGRFPYCRIY